MIDKADILKMVKHVTKRAGGSSDRRLLHPKREWLIGLAVSAACLIGGFIYNLNQFYYFFDIESEITPSDGKVTTYRYDVMQDLLDEFNGRVDRNRLLLEGVVPEPEEEEEG